MTFQSEVEVKIVSSPFSMGVSTKMIEGVARVSFGRAVNQSPISADFKN
jgi:hypothetical protein